MIQAIKDWFWMRIAQPLPIYEQDVAPILDRIFRISGLPDHPGYRARMAQTFMAIPDNGLKIRPITIAKALYRAMSNQTVYNYIQKIKEAEQKSKEASSESETSGSPQTH